MNLIPVFHLFIYCLFSNHYLDLKIILWGHGINSEKIYKKKRLSIKIRLKLAKAADAVLLYGRTASSYFEKFLDPEKIFIAYNTLDTEEYGRLKDKFKKLEFRL
jgi:hypothetical protein